MLVRQHLKGVYVPELSRHGTDEGVLKRSLFVFTHTLLSRKYTIVLSIAIQKSNWHQQIRQQREGEKREREENRDSPSSSPPFPHPNYSYFLLTFPSYSFFSPLSLVSDHKGKTTEQDKQVSYARVLYPYTHPRRLWEKTHIHNPPFYPTNCESHESVPFVARSSKCRRQQQFDQVYGVHSTYIFFIKWALPYSLFRPLLFFVFHIGFPFPPTTPYFFSTHVKM